MPALPNLTRHSVPNLLDRIRNVWQQHEVPDWHRQLFEVKYGGGDYGPEVLLRELQALQRGDALVQSVQASIRFREEVLMRLTLLRTGYDDAEFLMAGSLPRKHLFEQLEELRLSTFQCVEVLSAWRRFLRQQVGTCIVWPYDGPTGEVDANSTADQDYLVKIADEEVLRSFEAVVEISPERDPFLLFKSAGGAGWKESGRLCPPAAGSRKPRLERARLQLMEDELALSLRSKATPEKVQGQVEGIQSRLLQKLTERCQELGLERTGRIAPNLVALLRATPNLDGPEPGTVTASPEAVPAPTVAAPIGASVKLPVSVKRWRPKTR